MYRFRLIFEIDRHRFCHSQTRGEPRIRLYGTVTHISEPNAVRAPDQTKEKRRAGDVRRLQECAILFRFSGAKERFARKIVTSAERGYTVERVIGDRSLLGANVWPTNGGVLLSIVNCRYLYGHYIWFSGCSMG